jgi:integrase/recombinase XerC
VTVYVNEGMEVHWWFGLDLWCEEYVTGDTVIDAMMGALGRCHVLRVPRNDPRLSVCIYAHPAAPSLPQRVGCFGAPPCLRVSDKYAYPQGGSDMQATEEFLIWAERDRVRSQNTLKRYRSVFGQLAALDIDPVSATREDVERWWASRFDRSAATRDNELACLRSFYKWATRFDHRADDPTRRLDPPKVPIRVPRPIGRADLERLLALARESSPDLGRALALGAYGGLRVGEAAGLSWADVDVETRRIYVTGKGDKQRKVPLSPLLLDLLLPEVAGNVVTAGEQPYSADTLQRKVNRFIQRHGVEHTSHDLRKRGATLAATKGVPLNVIASAFGWSSIETVKHYAAVSDDALDALAAAMI